MGRSALGRRREILLDDLAVLVARKDPDLLLGLAERFLAAAGQFDTALELTQRFLEGQLALFEPLHDLLEFGPRRL
jgi:hypothetical protein